MPLISSVSFARQYAYNPPQSSQFQPPQLTHAQGTSVRQFQARESQADPRAMLPPPPPPPSNRAGGSGNFKPSTAHRITPHPTEQVQSAASSRRQMGPPSTPQITSNRAAFGSMATQPPKKASQHRVPKASYPLVTHDAQPTKTSHRFAGVPKNNRFMPSTNGFVPPTPTRSQRVADMHPSISREPSRAVASGPYASSGQGAQRIPFVPGAQGGFE